MIVFRLYSRVRARAAVLLWAPVLVVLIGLSRVYLGVHWASDVLFGWIFGMVWLMVCLTAHSQLVRRPALLRVGTKRSVSNPGPHRSGGTGQGTSRPS